MAETAQSEVYENVAKPIVDSTIRGYNSTIIAYGPTGSGKTHTMRGNNETELGIMPRCIQQLLMTAGRAAEIWASYLQLYCENITDLLSPEMDAAPYLQIREKAGSVFVEGLSKTRISNLSDLEEMLQKGDQNRKTMKTNCNATSSRSHAVLMVSIISDESPPSSDQSERLQRQSTLMLVDLAGSERASASAGLNYMRLEEAKAINLSLSALGNCMSALAEGKKTHIPYRDSKLTRLLQGSLGGGSRTAIIVNVAPGSDQSGEILNSLRFAARAAKVQVIAKVQRFVDYESLYSAAQARVDALQSAALQKDLALAEMRDSLERERAESERLRESLARLESQLELTQSMSPRKQAAAVAAATGGGLGAAAAAATREAELQADHEEMLARTVAAHGEELTRVRKGLEAKVAAAKRAAAEAAEEVSSLQSELQGERRRHLDTVQDYKAVHTKKISLEGEFQERLQELFAELADKNAAIENLTETLVSCQRESSDMISKEQVAEMEKLFLETVDRLAARVVQLEAGRLPSPGISRPPAPLTEDRDDGDQQRFEDSDEDDEPVGRRRDGSVARGQQGHGMGNGLPPLAARQQHQLQQQQQQQQQQATGAGGRMNAGRAQGANGVPRGLVIGGAAMGLGGLGVGAGGAPGRSGIGAVVNGRAKPAGAPNGFPGVAVGLQGAPAGKAGPHRI